MPTPHYSHRAKELCRTTVAETEVGSQLRLSAAVIMQLRSQDYGPRGVVPKTEV